MKPGYGQILTIFQRTEGGIISPSNLTAIPYSDTRIDLSWINNETSNYDGHKVYISTDGINFILFATILSIGTTYSATGLSAGTFYYFKITAYRGNTQSDYSNIASEYSLDTNAKAFTDVAGVVAGSADMKAINDFVIELKAINSVQANFVNFVTPASSILKAVYPFVGTTADTHKWNLINPADSDAAFRIHWGGTDAGAHSAQGYEGNGTDRYGDTHLTPSTSLTLRNTHIAHYNVTDVTFHGGCYDAGGRMFIFPTGCHMYISGTATAYADQKDSIGFYLYTRSSNISHSFYKNGKILNENVGIDTGALTQIPIWINARNHASSKVYSANKCGYFSVGDDVIAAAAVMYSAAVKKLMVAFGRRTADVTPVFAGVTFSFDDLTNVAYNTEVLGLAADYGMKNTHYVHGTDLSTQVGNMLLYLRNGGWIGGHTVNHTDRDVYLATHTMQEFWDNEVSPNLNAINAALGITNTIFAYALTGSDYPALQTFLYGKGVTFVRGNGAGTPKTYDGTNQYICALSVYNLGYDWNVVKAYIDDAYANGTILLIYSHKIDVTNDTNCISLTNLRQMCAYINSLGMTYYNSSELVPGLFN